jgi:hypothetical protein
MFESSFGGWVDVGIKCESLLGDDPHCGLFGNTSSKFAGATLVQPLQHYFERHPR